MKANVNENELLNCPFCGSPAQLQDQSNYIHGNMIVRCTNCRILTFPGPEYKVVSAWNKRTENGRIET